MLKVLGCSLATIRNMFLIEAGFIGFMGGLIGLALSFMVSVLINQFLAATFLYGMDGKLSVIPTWLAFRRSDLPSSSAWQPDSSRRCAQ